MLEIIKSREVYITNKLWNYFWKAISLSVVASVLTHLFGYPPKLGLAFKWSIPSLLILFVGNFLIKRTRQHPIGKYLLIGITTSIVFIGLWVNPSPYLLGICFITVVFSVFYLNKWVAILAVALNVLIGVILVYVYPRINSFDGPAVDSLNILGTYLIIGFLLYLLSKELEETIQEHAAAREIQDILSLGSDDGIILVDNSFKVVAFKDYLDDPVFRGSEDKILQQNFLALEAFAPLHSVLSEKKSVHSKELDVVNNGKSFPCTFSCFATRTARKRNIHSVILFKNLNKQRLMEQQLERTAKLALAGDIAAGLAHEVRNPLTVVKGYLEIMNGTDASPHKQYIEFMLEEIERANDLLTDFLYISKPQPLEYIEYNLERLLSDVVNLIYPTANIKGIKLQTDIKNTLPSVQIDAQQFKQVLLNILKNAVEATDAGGIVTFRAASEGGILTMQICDSGKGISKENLHKIFDAFFTTKDEGTGLGLAVSYRILQDHGCTVNVESEVGVGTKFTIQFPA